MIFTPKKPQLIAAEHIVKYPRCAIWADMGLGKTTAVLMALETILLIEDGPVLVIGTKRIARQVWPGEVRKFDRFSHLTVSVILGDNRQRAAAIKRKADIYTINYDNLQWLMDHCGDTWPWPIVVADESTRLKSFRLGGKGGKRARALAKRMFTDVTRFVELTGTPAPNGLRDLWGQFWFLDKGEALGRTFTSFTARWFTSLSVGTFAKIIPLPFAQKEITERTHPLAISLCAKDFFPDLKEPIEITVKVELPPKIMEIYREFEQELFAALDEDTNVEVFNAAAKSIKCLQIAGGAVYTDEKGNYREIHKAKMDALDSVINEAAGDPVLVAYHFKSDLARLQAHFPKARVLDEHPTTEEAWNLGRIPILLAHPQSAGHGLNLQHGGHRIAFFSHWWDLELRQQIIERIGPVRQLQAGYDRPVYVYNLLAAGTIDYTVLQRHKSKKSVQDCLMDARNALRKVA